MLTKQLFKGSLPELDRVLNIADPAFMIPVLENGIEIEKLCLAANPDNEDSKVRLRNSRVLLSLLRGQALGV
jgi:hypothetical protein